MARVYAGRQMADKSVLMALKALSCFGFVAKGAQLPALLGNLFEVEKWSVMMDEVIEAWIYLYYEPPCVN
jgi:hypothetical protein